MSPDIQKNGADSIYNFADQATQIWKAIHGELDEDGMQAILQQSRGCSLSDQIWRDLSQHALRYDRDNGQAQMAKTISKHRQAKQANHEFGEFGESQQDKHTPAQSPCVGTSMPSSGDSGFGPEHGLPPHHDDPLALPTPRATGVIPLTAEPTSAEFEPHADLDLLDEPPRKAWYVRQPLKLAFLAALLVFATYQL